VDLAATVARHKDEEIIKGSNRTHVEDNDVASLVVLSHAGTENGTINRGLIGGGLFTAYCCGSQRTSFHKDIPRMEVSRTALASAVRLANTGAVGHLRSRKENALPVTKKDI
jgi:hypothetical protein